MRSNRIIGYALALAAATAAPAAAQQQQPQPGARHEQGAREGRQGGPIQRLFQGIDLTDAQRQQVRGILAEGRPQRAAGEARGQRRAHDGQHGARRGEGRQHGQARPRRGERPELTAEQRAQLEQRREQQFARIRAILTPEQRAQFDRNVQQLRQARQQRGERRARS